MDGDKPGYAAEIAAKKKHGLGDRAGKTQREC